MKPKPLSYLKVPLHKSDPELYWKMVNSVNEQSGKVDFQNMEGVNNDIYECFMAFGALCWYMGYLTRTNDELKKLVN